MIKDKTKNCPTRFCRGAFTGWHEEWNWFGLNGLRGMSRDRVAKLTLAELSRGGGVATSGTYTGFRLEIINKVTGVVDKVDLFFDDYMVSRRDQRPDYKGGFSVVSHTGWDWYIAVPADVQGIVDAVECYMRAFE